MRNTSSADGVFLMGLFFFLAPDAVVIQIQLFGTHGVYGVPETHAPGRIFLVFVQDSLIHQLAVFPVGAHQDHKEPFPPGLREHIPPAQTVGNSIFQLGSSKGGFLRIFQWVSVSQYNSR